MSALYKDAVHATQQTLSTQVIQNQSVNAVQGKSHCLFWDPYKIYKYTVQEEFRIFEC
jgi:hypothetical protein